MVELSLYINEANPVHSTHNIEELLSEYQCLFEYSPAALVELDLSVVKSLFQHLSLKNGEIDDYAQNNPGFIDQCLSKIKNPECESCCIGFSRSCKHRRFSPIYAIGQRFV